jgi:drug/metabolite transporter (DMT)-like permease
MPLKAALNDFLERHWRKLPGNFRGAFWMLGAALSFIIVQAFTKALGGNIPSAEIAFFRAAIGSVAVIPFLMQRGLGAFTTQNLPFHIGRGVFGAMAIFLMVYAIVHMPIAEATVIGFTRMLFLIVLAVLFLGETAHWRRWMATLAGFCGVVLMLRPGDETFQLAALSALGAAFCFAAAHTCIKKCTQRKDHPMTVQTYYAAISTSLMLLPAIWVWITPSWEQMLLLLGMGVMSGVAQTCTAYAYNSGEATFVAPFDYTRLLWAALVGWFLFAEPLGFMTLMGAAVIIGSNAYIARRQTLENRAAKKKADSSN